MAATKASDIPGRAVSPRFDRIHAARSLRAREVARFEHEVDLVVVGYGATGACAALEAAAAGTRVLVLESRWRGGGSSAESTGQIYLGGGTPLQKACGFEDDPDEMYKYLVASCGPGVDDAKIRLFADGSVEHYQWLVGHGLCFENGAVPHDRSTMSLPGASLAFSGSERAWPFLEIARPAPRGHTVQKDGVGSGELMMQILFAAVSRAGVEVWTDARAESLVVEDDGRVVGVAVAQGGQHRMVRARRGVVLATGGFMNDAAMVRRYAPDLLRCSPMHAAADGDDGSGIRLGIGAGGAAVRMEAATIVLAYAYAHRANLRGILVNAKGQRYVNEDVYQSLHGELALRRQGGQVWLVVDDALYSAQPRGGEFAHLALPVAAVAETPEELERQLGMPALSLSQTLAAYNEHAARGEDPWFHKERCWLTPLVHPPYAALDLRIGHGPYTAFTLGGLWTRPSGEVLDAEGEPVPGLYAAGRAASGIPAQGYSSGLSLADCTWSGRLAGRSAARAGAT